MKKKFDLPITSEDRELLKHLAESENSMDIYLLHEKYRLSPGQLSRSIRKLIGLDVIKYSSGKVKFTENGRDWLRQNKKNVFHNIKMNWKDCPEKFLAEKLSIDSFYLPNFKKIDKSFFKNLIE